MFQIEEELKKLPGKPGVYIMHGEKDEIIYVGKAVSLKNRVRQYFQSSRNKGAKIEQMVTHITRFEYIITDSELEALVLECNLIKEHRPKYNTMLKDDSSIDITGFFVLNIDGAYKGYKYTYTSVENAQLKGIVSIYFNADGSAYVVNATINNGNDERNVETINTIVDTFVSYL